MKELNLNDILYRSEREEEFDQEHMFDANWVLLARCICENITPSKMIQMVFPELIEKRGRITRQDKTTVGDFVKRCFEKYWMDTLTTKTNYGRGLKLDDYKGIELNRNMVLRELYCYYMLLLWLNTTHKEVFSEFMCKLKKEHGLKVFPKVGEMK